MRLREARREAEEDRRLPSSLCEEVRQRNRLDRLRRACRQGPETMSLNYVIFNFITIRVFITLE